MRTAEYPYLRAIGKRLLAGIPVFVVVTFAATALSNLAPGSAAQLILGENATPQQIADLNAQYGYDLPVWQRYAVWLGRLVQGDLGLTLYSRQSVAGLLFDRAAVTFEIAFLAMLLSLLLGVPIAMLTASRAGGMLDKTLLAVSSVMLSVPTFVIVVLLGFVFAIVLRWLPATGWVPFSEDPLANLACAALPVMCLSVHQTASFYRIARSEFVAVLQEDYVMVARAKGLPARYILARHALRPALPQVLTVMGLSMTFLLGGSFIVESYFAVPGIGWTVLSAVNSHDFPVMQAILSLTVVIFVVVFILVDLGYALVDPKGRRVVTDPVREPRSPAAPAMAEVVAASLPKTARLRWPSLRPFEWFAFGFLLLLALTAAFVDYIPGLARPNFPYGDFSQPPEWSLNGILGTDPLGRSILSRVLHGARTSLGIVCVATAISLVIGMAAGMLAGFYRGPIERAVDLWANTMASLPPILMILALIAVVGNSVLTMMLALGILDIGVYARIAKGGVISQNDRDYVLAARAMGATDGRILVREILPNLVPALTAIVPPLMAGLIVTEGSLSFLGYGIPQPAPSWGGMIASSTDLLSRFPLLVVGPILAIVLTVYSLNTIGDCLARRLDDRQREL